MGLRETLNENPGITTAATAIIILAALVFVVVSLFRGSDGPTGSADKEYYTDDDGKSWFIDDRSKIPPFERNGKQAVRARLFTCDGGQTKFVGWLERYPADAKKRLEEAAREAGGTASGGFMLEDQTGLGLEYKKPGTGDKGWVRNTDPAVQQIIDIKCPDGTVDKLEPVAPP